MADLICSNIIIFGNNWLATHGVDGSFDCPYLGFFGSIRDVSIPCMCYVFVKKVCLSFVFVHLWIWHYFGLPHDEFRDMKKSILVVEDEPGFRKLLKHALSAEYNVTAVENGQQAIDSLKLLPVDLVVTDVNMPQVNGFELITFLKSNPVFKQIPVVVISSFDEDVFMQQVKPTELDGYFQKPMDVNALKAKIGALLFKSVLA